MFTRNREAVVSRLAEFRFRSIEQQALEESVGWVPPLRVFDSEFNHEDVYFDELIFLCMRLDRKSVPRVLLDARVNEMIHTGEASPNGRAELKQLKEDVARELLARMLPTPRLVEGVIDASRNTLYLNAAAARTSRLFINLFEKTFGMLPVHIDPTRLVYLATGDLKQVQKLAETGESCFHDL